MVSLLLGVLLMGPVDEPVVPVEGIRKMLPPPTTFFDSEETLEVLRAIEAADEDRLKALIDAGADPGAVGRHGMTPMMWCRNIASLECMRVLLEAGASPEVRLFDVPHGPLLRDGDCLISSLCPSKDELFFGVLEHVQNPNVRGQWHSILFTEVWQGLKPNTKERFEALLDRGADPDMLARYSPAASECVLQLGSPGPEMALLLLERGADPHAWNEGINRQLIDRVYSKHSKYIERGREVPPLLQRLIDRLAEEGATLEMAARRREFWRRYLDGLPPNDGSRVNIRHYLVALRKQAQLSAATPEEAEEAARRIAEGVGVDLDEAQRAARLFVEQPLEVKLEFLNGREAEVRRIADLRAEIYLTAWRAERGLPPRVARPGEDPVPTGDPDALERSPDAFWRQPLTWIEKYGGQPDE